MKIRIQNDGKPAYSTTVTDVETGKQLEYVTRVDLTIDVHDQLPQALLTMITPVVDVIADAEIRQVCPCCGKPTEQKLTPSQSVIQAVKDAEDAETADRIRKEREDERAQKLRFLISDALQDARVGFSGKRLFQIGDALADAIEHL